MTMSFLSRALPLLLLALQFRPSLCNSPIPSDGTCYWPDGSTADNLKPCVSASKDGHSSCCDPKSDICLDTGFCFELPTNQIARKACTDKKWSTGGSCAQSCLEGRRGSETHIYALDDDDSSTWCCGGWNTTSGNCLAPDEPFQYHPGKIVAGFGVLANNSDFTSSSTSVTAAPEVTKASLTSAGFPSSTSVEDNTPTCTRRLTAVGAGLGVPLGFSILILLTLLYIEKRRTRELRTQLTDAIRRSDPNNTPPISFQSGYPIVPHHHHHHHHHRSDGAVGNPYGKGGDRPSARSYSLGDAGLGGHGGGGMGVNRARELSAGSATVVEVTDEVADAIGVGKWRNHSTASAPAASPGSTGSGGRRGRERKGSNGAARGFDWPLRPGERA